MMVDKLTINLSSVEKKLMDTFFPGPFTLIVNRTSLVPDTVTAGLDTVAIRMPENQIAKEIIKKAGVPIAAPSANISGKPSGTMISDIIRELGDKVDYIVDGGPCQIGLESTVVKVINDVPHILRPGAITKEQLLAITGKVTLDSHLFTDCNENDTVLSPGMKHSHYAPNSKCLLVYGKDNDILVDKINELAKNYSNPLVITNNENVEKYSGISHVLTVGSKYDLLEISHNIFSILRKIDSYHADMVLIEGVSKNGIGLAIMNRLIRACSYHYIDLDEE